MRAPDSWTLGAKLRWPLVAACAQPRARRRAGVHGRPTGRRRGATARGAGSAERSWRNQTVQSGAHFKLNTAPTQGLFEPLAPQLLQLGLQSVLSGAAGDLLQRLVRGAIGFGGSVGPTAPRVQRGERSQG